ncbi:hypothetical protein [Streptomyces sp. Y7]
MRQTPDSPVGSGQRLTALASEPGASSRDALYDLTSRAAQAPSTEEPNR